MSEVKVSFQFRHSFLLTSSQLKLRQKPTSGEWRGLVGLILSAPQ